jgi:hypothetical protein
MLSRGPSGGSPSSGHHPGSQPAIHAGERPRGNQGQRDSLSDQAGPLEAWLYRIDGCIEDANSIARE